MKKNIPLILALSFFIFSEPALAAPMDKAKLNPPLPSNIWTEMSRISQPGVVGIFVDVDMKSPQRLRRDPLFDFLEEFLGQGHQFQNPLEEGEDATPIGTGFVIDKDGLIVTNYHVINAIDNPNLKTRLRVKINGESVLHNVKLIGGDARGDIALLQLEKKVANLNPLELGDSDQLKVGEYVAAFGNPYGHSNSMTVGIVSALGRAIKELNRFPFIQTDASINPGNSGGPLLNTQGYVIGVNTAIDARAQGIGFAIPINYVKKVINVIRSGGTIQRAFLGVELANIHPQISRSYGITKPGALVTRVENGYPAALAGLKPNDFIFEFNGSKVSGVEDLINQVQDSEIGKPLPVKILRPQSDNKFKEEKLLVTLSTHPGDQKLKSKAAPGLQKYKGLTVPYNLGFSVESSSSGARHHFSVPMDFAFGPIVSNVSEGSLAATAGIEVGDVVLEVNNEEVNTASDVVKRIRQGSNQLTLQSATGIKSIVVSTQ